MRELSAEVELVGMEGRLDLSSVWLPDPALRND
jgi:hypothetical protein